MQLVRDYIKDFFHTLLNLSDRFSNFLVVIVMIIFWIVLGKIVSFITNRILKRMYQVSQKHINTHNKHNETLSKMIHTLLSYTFWFFIIVMILSELSINILPVIASAGIIAFAVGFGAQSLIKDLISGFFLISERAFDVGDVIEIGNQRGTVTEIGMRRTRLINWKNEVTVINNGDIKVLTNFSQGLSIALVEFTIPYTADLNVYKSKELAEALVNLKKQFPQIVETPKFDGIMALRDNGLLIRFSAKTQNGQHGEVQLAMAALINKIAQTPKLT